LIIIIKSQGNSDVMVPGYRLIQFLGWEFLCFHRVQNGSEAHTDSHTVGKTGSLLGVKRQCCEADHSPPSKADLKEWVEIYIHSPIRLHNMVLS